MILKKKNSKPNLKTEDNLNNLSGAPKFVNLEKPN